MTTKMYSYKRERAKRLYPEPAIFNRNELFLLLLCFIDIFCRPSLVTYSMNFDALSACADPDSNGIDRFISTSLDRSTPIVSAKE